MSDLKKAKGESKPTEHIFTWNGLFPLKKKPSDEESQRFVTRILSELDTRKSTDTSLPKGVAEYITNTGATKEQEVVLNLAISHICNTTPDAPAKKTTLVTLLASVCIMMTNITHI